MLFHHWIQYILTPKMRSQATSVQKYLQSLSADRRKTIAAVRAMIRKNLPKGFEEAMNWGMITYQVPLKRLPDTYNGQPLCYAALASQKNYMALYLMSVYADKELERWFRQQFRAAEKKLDMGKSCIRFRRLEDLPLEVIGQTIGKISLDEYIERYERGRARK
ncbi:MAG TPA: DUF1801 domain-containing protein [Acidobacteriota bacterium]